MFSFQKYTQHALQSQPIKILNSSRFFLFFSTSAIDGKVGSGSSESTSSSSGGKGPVLNDRGKPLKPWETRGVPHKKFKPPQKRASFLMNILRKEEYLKLKSDRQWPRIYAGDSVEILRLPFVTSTVPDVIRGVVLGQANRSSDTSVRIINNEFGIPVVRRIKVYNPLIQNVRVLQRAFIHQGLKRVRGAKINYLIERDPGQYTVKYESDEDKKKEENAAADKGKKKGQKAKDRKAKAKKES